MKKCCTYFKNWSCAFVPKLLLKTNISHIGTCSQSCHTAELSFAIHPANEWLSFSSGDSSTSNSIGTPLICRIGIPQAMISRCALYLPCVVKKASRYLLCSPWWKPMPKRYSFPFDGDVPPRQVFRTHNRYAFEWPSCSGRDGEHSPLDAESTLATRRAGW